MPVCPGCFPSVPVVQCICCVTLCNKNTCQPILKAVFALGRLLQPLSAHVSVVQPPVERTRLSECVSCHKTVIKETLSRQHSYILRTSTLGGTVVCMVARLHSTFYCFRLYIASQGRLTTEQKQRFPLGLLVPGPVLDPVGNLFDLASTTSPHAKTHRGYCFQSQTARILLLMNLKQLAAKTQRPQTWWWLRLQETGMQSQRARK